jgi:hypothetical protein
MGIGGTPALKVEFQSGGDKLRVNDSVVISGSNSVGSADGGYIIRSVNLSSNPQFLILNYGDGNTTPLPTITKAGSGGTLTYKTTFESQVGGIIGDAGGAVAGSATGIVGDVLDKAFPGFSQYETPILLFLLFIVLLVLYGYVKPLVSGGGGTTISDINSPYIINDPMI